MAIVVCSGSPTCPFTITEDRLGHFKFAKFTCQRNQFLFAVCPSRGISQTVVQRKQRIQRNQSLIGQYRSNLVGHLRVYLLTFRARLASSREQVDEFVL